MPAEAEEPEAHLNAFRRVVYMSLFGGGILLQGYRAAHPDFGFMAGLGCWLVLSLALFIPGIIGASTGSTLQKATIHGALAILAMMVMFLTSWMGAQ